jgi:cytochrome c
VIESIQKYKLPDTPNTLMIGQKDGSFIGFKEIDLTAVEGLTFVTMAPKQYGMTGGKIEVRIDSPTGELIGESTPIVPNEGSGQMPPPIMAKAKIKGMTGMHDLYFVYKSGSTPPGQMLFVIAKIVVNPNSKPATVSLRN